jgi:Uma2 family endonuclease
MDRDREIRAGCRAADVALPRHRGRPGGAKDYTATAPVLLVEVLSPSTAATDLGDKAAEYLHIPSLTAYSVLSQDEPKAWVWARATAQFASGPAVIAGTEAIIRIAALQLKLPLAEIYAGMEAG